MRNRMATLLRLMLEGLIWPSNVSDLRARATARWGEFCSKLLLAITELTAFVSTGFGETLGLGWAERSVPSAQGSPACPWRESLPLVYEVNTPLSTKLDFLRCRIQETF